MKCRDKKLMYPLPESYSIFGIGLKPTVYNLEDELKMFIEMKRIWGIKTVGDMYVSSVKEKFVSPQIKE